MSHPDRPVPVQPPLVDNRTQNMAETQRQPHFSSSAFRGRPDQWRPGPQLPPIQPTSQDRSSHELGSRNIQLPSMQVPQSETFISPPRTVTRSIPVSHLLSSDPSSPPRQQARSGAQQTSSGVLSSSHVSPPMGFRPQPLSYPQAPQHRLDQAPAPFRQPSQVYQTEQYPRAHYPPVPPQVRPDQGVPRQYSPAISGYSSPSYTHSEVSRRSSLGPANLPQPRVSQAPPLNYNLSIRQQPVAARACGFGERDRRVVDPPPIIELKITDHSGMPEQDPTAMLALHCSLLSSDGHDDETEFPPANGELRSTTRLMGTTVASTYQAKDENGIAGTFFVFPDLSCRSPGKYRLRFELIRVNPMNTALGPSAGKMARIVTEVFSVYTAKDFPGMRASSALLKALRRQGLNVGIKKGSEARKGKGKAKKEADSGSSSEGEGESDGGSESRGYTSSSGVSPKTKARK